MTWEVHIVTDYILIDNKLVMVKLHMTKEN